MFRAAAALKARPRALLAVGTAGCVTALSQSRSSGFMLSQPLLVAAQGKDSSTSTESHAPLIMCGPSGVGKGTLVKRVMQEYPGQFGFCVSTTTRKPRPGEVEGKDYHYTDNEAMEKEIEEGKFIEYAKVHTSMYGTSIAALTAVRDQGKVAILDIDIQGAQSCKAKLPGAHYFFLSPPSMEILEARLRGRGTESEAKVQVRLKNAHIEMDFSSTPGFFEKNIVADNNFEKAWPEFKMWLESAYPQLESKAS